jgi:hypothetical protein
VSGVNPALAAAAAGNAAEAALALELQTLAQDAKALQAMLMTGDIVQATVQPFNGITDTLQIFGMRVAASLPPNVYPGDTLTVAVQGFSGDQVLVQVMSRTPAPNTLAQNTTSTPQAVSEPTDSVELTRTPIPVVVDEAAFPPQAPPPPPTTTTSTTPTVSTQEEAAPEPGSVVSVPPSIATAAQANLTTKPEMLSIEARLAFARTPAPPPPATASAAARATPPPRPTPQTMQAADARASTTPSSTASRPASNAAPPVPPRSPFAPIITPRPDGTVRSAPPPIPGAPTQTRAQAIVPQAQAQAEPPTAEELLSDPAQLLRALRIPQTPTSLTFAKLVTAQPEQVATALRALETALPDSEDPRISTLRTLAAFVGNLDPESPTFESQVTSYISQVIEGPEQKLMAALPQAAAQAAAPAEAAAETTPAAPQAQAAAAAAPAAADEGAIAARMVERVAAADADIKTQLVALLSNTQPESVLGDTATVLARNALTGIVASQLSAIASQQSQPGTWTFTIPISLAGQMYPARIAVSRDKPEGQNPKITGDDFHIAFILDTKRLGTIAVDLHAVQRSVSVSVRTERPSAATTFKSALTQLGKRLEDMRYNVKSLEAGTTRVKSAVESQEPPPTDSLSSMDSKA